jgi:arylsulfatase A-like enzyme
MKNYFSLLFILLSVGAWSQKADQPNVILVMADDLGWGDTGYNGNKIIKTPHLDQMSKEGLTFNRFYSASSVCSPTRASVLTGRHSSRTGIFNANNGILRPEEITIAELLKDRGYATGHFGKWHLGTLTHTEKDANRGRPDNTKEYNPPSWHGYDEAFVTESKVPTYDPMKKPVTGATREGWDYIKKGESYNDYGTYYWDIDGNKVEDNLEGDDSRVIMDRVIPFIDQAVSNNKSFFAVVWFHTPHLPCVAGPEHAAMYNDYDSYTKNYAGCITAMDEQIGRLRQFLKALNVSDNTMIWFCSDNGPEVKTPGSTGGFRDRKRSLHDGGVRVPGLLVWPEIISEAEQTDIPCVTSDYLPTIMDALDISLQTIPYELDGISLMPLISGQMSERPTPIGMTYQKQRSFMDDRYKIYLEADGFKLYDMVKDPYETTDISGVYPEKVQELKQVYLKWLGRCQLSFEGEEYGQESFNKLQQKWPYETIQK